jgi:hypothetical protein
MISWSIFSLHNKVKADMDLLAPEMRRLSYPHDITS